VRLLRTLSGEMPLNQLGKTPRRQAPTEPHMLARCCQPPKRLMQTQPPKYANTARLRRAGSTTCGHEWAHSQIRSGKRGHTTTTQVHTYTHPHSYSHSCQTIDTRGCRLKNKHTLADTRSPAHSRTRTHSRIHASAHARTSNQHIRATWQRTCAQTQIPIHARARDLMLTMWLRVASARTATSTGRPQRHTYKGARTTTLTHTRAKDRPLNRLFVNLWL